MKTSNNVVRAFCRSLGILIAVIAAVQLLPAAASTADFDSGNIAVIFDDGTLINLSQFDLDGVTIRFTPNSAGYDVASIPFAFDGDLGTRVLLNSGLLSNVSVNLGFTFPFFGANFTAAFVNYPGNITFGGGDPDPSESLTEFATGPRPRIAPWWNGFGTTADTNGGVFFKTDGNRAVITWKAVIVSGSDIGSTFQATLASSGVVTFSYNGTTVLDGHVGLSPCCQAPNLTGTSLNFSHQLPVNGLPPLPIYEVFGGTGIIPGAVARRFYASHADGFDFLAVFGASVLSGVGGTAFFSGVRNDVSGLGLPIFDQGATFGSAKRLQGVATMSALTDDVEDNEPLLAHETLHRWAAFVDVNLGGGCSSTLAPDGSHWSRFLHTDRSHVGGSRWIDNGDGSFTEDASAPQTFGPLDQYLMGIRAAEEVPDFFFIANPVQIGTFRWTGTRQNVALSQIQACEGPRVPAFNGTPSVFTQAFILLVPQGKAVSALDLAYLENLRKTWKMDFATKTGGRAKISTSLITFTDDPLTPATSVRAVHFTELRNAVNTVRSRFGLAAFSFTDPTLVPGLTTVSATHVLELRAALNQVYAVAGQPAPTYTDVTVSPVVTVIKAAHVTELRSAVRAVDP